MEIGFVGLGRMGGNMALRLASHGHRVVGYDPAPAARQTAEAAGTRVVGSLTDLAKRLPRPRVVWVMVPAGEPSESVIGELAGLLEPGDTVVDGGNTHYKDNVRRAAELAARGVSYLDVGVSGGIWGRELGYCLMVGGGHYVKMIHNGIEYGLMQAYAEGFELMSVSEYGLDLAAVARLWTRGSVVRSWLLELTADVLDADPRLGGLRAWVDDSGEGRWTVQEAVNKAVPAPAITAALFARFRSRREDAFADRLLAALRRAFGGHAVRR